MKQKKATLKVKPAMSKRKKAVLFRLIAILLPFVLLMVLEIILRIAGYGDDYRVFLEDKSGNYLYLNPQIGKKYFTSEKNSTVGAADPFRKIKDSSVYRIFVLGESTSAGFPYLYNGTFPRVLKYRLERAFPDKNIEMINLSLTAVNSYTLLDLTEAVTEQQPDAILIYVGHNEYHGTLGVASTSSFGTNGFLIRTLLYCKKFKVVQLVLNVANKFKKNNTALTNPDRTLMERMASGQKVPLGSKLYEEGIRQFDTNLNAILQDFNEHHIPVFIGNLVSNRKDLKPFISSLNSSKYQAEWKTYFEKGVAAYNVNDTIQSYTNLTRANQVDSSYALCHYLLGNIAYHKGNYVKAYQYYLIAKELDNLRFRAPEVFNDIIKKRAGQYQNVTLVDIKTEFENESPHRILGKELFLEHVHPNLEGYFLMAGAYYNALESKRVIGADWSRGIPAPVIRPEIPVTAFDTIYGNLATISLKEHWPFNEPIPGKTNIGNSFEGNMAVGLMLKQITWKNAMAGLYNHYMELKDYKQALKITEGLVLDNPYDARYIQQAARLAAATNNQTLSLLYLKNLWRFAHNMDLARQLFIAALNADQPEESVAFIDYAITNNSTAHDFTPLKGLIEEIILYKGELLKSNHKADLLSRISKAYFLTGCSLMGKKYFGMAYKTDKENPTVKELQKQFQLMPDK